jgi:hypothetical protein
MKRATDNKNKKQTVKPTKKTDKEQEPEFE